MTILGFIAIPRLLLHPRYEVVGDVDALGFGFLTDADAADSRNTGAGLIRHGREQDLETLSVRAAAEGTWIETEDELADPRRTALVVEERTRLVAKVSTGHCGRHDLDGEHQGCSLGIAERDHRATHRRRGVGRRITVLVQRPSLRDLPALLGGEFDLAAGLLGHRQIDNDRRGIRPGEPKGNRIGTEDRARSAPRSDRLRRVAEDQAGDTVLGEALDVVAGNAEVVRVGNGDPGDRCLRRHLDQCVDGHVERREGESIPSIDARRRRSQHLQHRNGVTDHLAGDNL